jgi:hypothetical protein
VLEEVLAQVDALVVGLLLHRADVPALPSSHVRSMSGLLLSRIDRVIMSSMLPAQAVWSFCDAMNAA